MKRKFFAVLFAAAFSMQASLAQNIQPCNGGGPADARAAAPYLDAAMHTAGGCDNVHVWNCILFQNREHRLPQAGANESYREARFDVNANPGPRRMVFRYTGAFSVNGATVARYYTADHYATFCRM